MKLQTEHLRLTATDGQRRTQCYTGRDATDGTLETDCNRRTATDSTLHTDCYIGHGARYRRNT